MKSDDKMIINFSHMYVLKSGQKTKFIVHSNKESDGQVYVKYMNQRIRGLQESSIEGFLFDRNDPKYL